MSRHSTVGEFRKVVHAMHCCLKDVERLATSDDDTELVYDANGANYVLKETANLIRVISNARKA